MEQILVKNEINAIERMWELIETFANAAIEDRSVFRIGLSGASLIKYLANGAENSKTDWSKWQLYFCDERFVDETNEDSTFGQYKKLFIPKTKLTDSQFVVINRSLALSDCAADYERQILERFNCQKVCMIYVKYWVSMTLLTKLFYLSNSRKYHNSTYFCLEWVSFAFEHPLADYTKLVVNKKLFISQARMDTRVLCFQGMHYWMKNLL